MNYDYPHLTVTVHDGVATVLIDNPPINLMTSGLFRSLAKVSVDLSNDDDVRVVVLRSANPEFFIAHFDVAAILEFPTDGEAVEEPELGGFDRMCEAYRTMDKVTIAELRGRVGGGGAELSSACDMSSAISRHSVEPNGGSTRHPSGRWRHPTYSPPHRYWSSDGSSARG